VPTRERGHEWKRGNEGNIVTRGLAAFEQSRCIASLAGKRYLIHAGLVLGEHDRLHISPLSLNNHHLAGPLHPHHLPRIEQQYFIKPRCMRYMVVPITYQIK